MGFFVHRPLDFVGAFSNRWSLAFAFGATANKIMIMFSDGYLPQQVPRWAQGKPYLPPDFGLVLVGRGKTMAKWLKRVFSNQEIVGSILWSLHLKGCVGA